MQALARTAANPSGRKDGTNTNTHERILRYPDGKERRILYPVVDEKESCEEFCDTCFDETWEIDHPWDIPAFGPSASLEPTAYAITDATRTAPRKVSELPSSPAELLRYLTSDDYKRAQQEMWDRVRSSYQIMHGCPWVAPKPLYVLAARQRASDAGMTYTLRTRISRKEAEDELSRVLKRTRADGSALIRVEQLVDGVVAFEDEANAARFAALLEAEGVDTVSLMQCNSHELFRTVSEVQAVVVLLQHGCELPQPDMLAASLRGQRPADDL